MKDFTYFIMILMAHKEGILSDESVQYNYVLGKLTEIEDLAKSKELTIDEIIARLLNN